jgi:hypothetical protein
MWSGDGRRVTGDGPAKGDQMPTLEDGPRKKLGVCNFCNDLGPVYEQEDEYRPLFLVCKRCIGDIFTGLESSERSKNIRKKLRWDNPGA